MINRRHLLQGGLALGALAAGSAPAMAIPPDHPVGVYVNDDLEANVVQWENWLGLWAYQVGVFVGHAGWDDYYASWALNHISQSRRMHFTVPPLVTGATYAQAVAGAYDAYYLRVAQEIAAKAGTEGIGIRIGQEFNLEWSPWSVTLGNGPKFINVFRRMVNIFRGVNASRFYFEWCPNWNNRADGQAEPVELCYPGNPYVDVIGMDAYYINQWDQVYTPGQAFAVKRDAPRGYNWARNFAAARAKFHACTEWGVDVDNKAAYIDAQSTWMHANPPAYHMYWNRTTGGANCRISTGTRPINAAAYKADFMNG